MIKKVTIPCVILTVCIFIAWVLFDYFKFKLLFDDSNIISHYGIFIGFGLTIYTFIISVIESITDRVKSKVSIERQQAVINSIFNSIGELKQDIIAIFVLFILHLMVDMIQSKEIFIHYLDVVQQGFFFYSITLLYDIAKVLFGFSEISMLLLKDRKKN